MKKFYARLFEGEGVGENLLVELTSSILVEYSVDKMSCRRNVASTKYAVDDVFLDKKFSIKCFDKNFVDEMFFDKSVIRRKA